jgi:hypothetical protein
MRSTLPATHLRDVTHLLSTVECQQDHPFEAMRAANTAATLDP